MKGSKLIPNTGAAARYGVTVRTIDNWIANPKLGFPTPIVINGRKYHSEQALDDFDQRAPRGGADKAA